MFWIATFFKDKYHVDAAAEFGFFTYASIFCDVYGNVGRQEPSAIELSGQYERRLQSMLGWNMRKFKQSCDLELQKSMYAQFLCLHKRPLSAEQRVCPPLGQCNVSVSGKQWCLTLV
ncbi:unnamed protein product [Ranitomeya imitator]|uniref:Peptidase M13 C-terminal domain-containing protein n=1 Tax=Ranitomeya imitator TaxID=111125 RepID=A0ABN9MSY2_9NEOB|nr:unnamed protein product [Ranitomeya imitator]